MNELPRVLQKGLKFRQKLIEGENLSGAWSTLGSAEVSFLMARAGLDYILIDLEHGSGGVDSVIRQVQALLSLDTAVMVRLPDHDSGSIKRILDAGANAILAPAVDTLSQATAIQNSALFVPGGQRGVAVGAIAASDFGYLPAEYFTHANEATTIILQVESQEAVENLPELAAMERIDGFFVGPNDLSAALGVFRDYENPLFKGAFQNIKDTVLNAGKMLGALPFPGMTSADLHDLGAQLAPFGSDQLFLRNGATQTVQQYLEKS